MKFKVIIIIVVVLLVAFSVICQYSALKYKMPWNIKKARVAAEEYVSQKYNMDLIAEHVITSVAINDGSAPFVLFRDKDGVQFEVDENYEFVATRDTYAEKLFEAEFQKQHKKEIQNLWLDEIELEAYPEHFGEKIDETSFVNGSFDYELYEEEKPYNVRINLPDTDDLEKYAERTFYTIEYLKNNNLHAKNLIVHCRETDGGNSDNSGFVLKLSKDYKSVDDVRENIE